jgi:PAS domain S-box-containing protein
MSEKTYRDIVDNAFEGIFQVQPDGTPISVNPAMARMLGYADAAALRHAAPSLTALLVDPSQRGALRRALRVRGRISGFETRLRTRGGGTVVCELAARVVPGEGGGPALIEGSVFDVTERIERERAERESAAARAASEAKSSFLSNMSHEIRTPMNAVIGFANLALQTGSSPRQRDYLRRIVAAAEALLRIINDILDFSKMEAGRLTMEAIELDLEEVLIHAIAAVELQAEENGLALLVDLDPAMPMRLIGDPLRLGQVLLNLLGNAVKFTDQGTVVLRLRVRPLDTGRARLDGSVTDTGPGLTEAETARLFESFSQADDSTTRRHGGTGLGLAICRNLVELMDGAIDVRSEPGRGSTFRFHVMLGLAAPAGDGPADVPAGAPRVLVLDANPDGRMLLARYLANAGYRAAAYADGLLAAPDGAPAAAVLIDAQLPVDSIAALCRRIKARADRSRVCCLLVCGGLLQAELERSGWPAGLDGFIGKPVLPRSLREQLAARLGPGTATPGAPGRERGQSCATPGSGSTRLLPAGGPDEDPAVPVMPTDATATGGPALRGPAPDLDDIGALIRALDRALELDARRALRLAEALDEVLGRTGWHAGFRRVHRLVRELDTDQARESLAKLAETIGVPLP